MSALETCLSAEDSSVPPSRLPGAPRILPGPWSYKEQPKEVTVHGKPLRCVICQNDTFYQRRAQLHGPVATLFNLEW